MLGPFGSSLRASRPTPSFATTLRIGSRLTSRGFALEASPKPSRLQKYARRTAYLAIGLGAAYTADRTFYASTITRNLRTFYTVRLVRDLGYYFIRRKPSHISTSRACVIVDETRAAPVHQPVHPFPHHIMSI